MAQQNIDFGAFPNDPAADPIRAAFQKIQENFTELYLTSFSSGVTSVTIGAGLQPAGDNLVGNVTISANIPNVTIQTGNNLRVGVGVASGNTATISTFSTPFKIDLSNNITLTNVVANSVRTNNLAVLNQVSTALIPNVSETYNLGSPTNRWKDLYLSGSTLYLGTAPITSTGANIVVPNLIANTSVSVGTTIVKPTTIDIGLTTISTNGNVLVTSSFSTTNFVASSITGGNATISGNITVTGTGTIGNAVATNLSATTATVTGNANIGNVSTTGITAVALTLGNANITGNANIGNISTGALTASNINSGNAVISNATIANINGTTITTSSLTVGNTSITGNANITILNANSFSANTIVGNLIPSSNVTQNLGSPTRRWKDLYLSGNTIALDTATVSASNGGILVPSLTANSTISTGTTTLSSNGTLTLGSASLSSNGSALTTTQLITSGPITINNITINQSGGALQIGGNLSTTGGINAGTSVTATSLNTSTITLGSATLSSNGGSLVTPSLTVNGVTTLSNLSVSGNLNAGNVSATYIGGQLTNGNQPGITSVGVLNGLTVTGDLTTGNIQVAGNLEAANLAVQGAFTAATITGNVIVPEGGALHATGNTGEIQFNDGGNATAVPGLKFDKDKNLLSIAGNVSGGNLVSTGALSISSQADIGGPATIGGSLTVNSDGSISGNLSAGNLTTKSVGATTGSFSGALSAGSFNAGSLTSANANITGNANIGNVNTTAIISSSMTSGNATITGNAVVGNISTSAVSAVGITASGNASIGGNATIGNISTSAISAVGISASGNASIDGNATIGNVATSGITASGNIISGNLKTSLVSASTLNTSSHATIGGNMTAGNAIVGRIIASGDIDATKSKVSAQDIITSGVHTANVVQATSLTTASLSATGGANITGNANIGNINTGIVAATTGNFNDITITGTHTVNKFSASSAVINGVVSVSGNIDAGNITTKNVKGEIVTVSGNVSGANLVASGVLQVTGNASVGNLITTGANISGEANVTGNHFIGGYANIGGGANIKGNASIGNIGTTQLVTSGLANLASALVKGDANIEGTLNGAGAKFTTVSTTGNITAGNLDAGSGAIKGGTFTATLFVGNGASLQNIPGANVTGIVPKAGESSYASVANSVSGANVSGKVANSAYSDSANKADVATTATIAKDLSKGNYSNITGVGTLGSLTVTGDGSFSNVTANHYGNGFNLSGLNAANISGTIAYANYSTYAGTVLTAAQTNITSVGQLSSLAVTANITTTAGYFIGNGSYITSLTGSQVTGQVNYAATANSVAWGNVSDRPTNVSSFTNDSGYLTTQYSPPQAIGTTANVQFYSLGIGTAASSVSGEIRAANNITAYYSSDSRLKEDIRNIDNALAKVRALNGVYFNWRQSVIDARGGEDGMFVRRGDTGIIAQEIEQVLPEVVATRADGYKAVQYEKMVGLLIEAIKELDDKVEIIKQKVEGKK